MTRVFATLFVCLATAVPADAQIYTWRDAAGHLVLSNRPRPQESASLATYVVTGPRVIRTTSKPPSARASSEYDALIRYHAAAHGLSPDLVRAVIQAESAFNPRAVSPKGAMGLMQLMPATARELGVVDPFHPAENIRAGVTYLARLLTRYNHDVELALAAYNAGPGSVERYGAVPPYRETQQYVKKITSATSALPDRSESVIYKWTEHVNGRSTVRYSNVPPASGPYEIVGRR